MKKILFLIFVLILSLSSIAFAFEPNSKEWKLQYSDNNYSIYSYNAPPILCKLDIDNSYVEIMGHVLMIPFHESKVSHYQLKIKTGIRIKEKQMWIEYLQQVAYDKKMELVPIKTDSSIDSWHNVLHNTVEEGYGLALFQAFKEYADSGYYAKDGK